MRVRSLLFLFAVCFLSEIQSVKADVFLKDGVLYFTDDKVEKRGSSSSLVGASPSLNAYVSEYFIGDVNIGESKSPTQTAGYCNLAAGNEATQILQATFVGSEDFTIEDNCSNRTILRECCYFSVTFKPSVPGPQVATITSPSIHRGTMNTYLASFEANGVGSVDQPILRVRSLDVPGPIGSGNAQTITVEPSFMQCGVQETVLSTRRFQIECVDKTTGKPSSKCSLRASLN